MDFIKKMKIQSKDCEKIFVNHHSEDTKTPYN